jgi:hypothetical protein
MLVTLPWHLKAAIIGFDCVTFLMKQRQGSSKAPNDTDPRGQTASDMFRSILQISCLFLFVMVTILSPSLFLSVKHREKTNKALSGVLSQLHHFTWLLIAANENIVSLEHVCYSLQFCFCYASFCVWRDANNDRFLFACNAYVKHSSFIAMFFFPVIFSKALVNGMHMSPYIIPITFSGELVGMSSTLATVVLDQFTSML